MGKRAKTSEPHRHATLVNTIYAGAVICAFFIFITPDRVSSLFVALSIALPLVAYVIDVINTNTEEKR
jgi:hypothetical protein